LENTAEGGVFYHYSMCAEDEDPERAENPLSGKKKKKKIEEKKNLKTELANGRTSVHPFHYYLLKMASLQWMLVTYFLYAEIAVFLFLVAPLPGRWKTALFGMIASSPVMDLLRRALIILTSFILLLFVDAVRKSRSKAAGEAHVQKMDRLALCFAQRNTWISGMAIFLMLVLNAFYKLIKDNVETAKTRDSAQAHLDVLKKQIAGGQRGAAQIAEMTAQAAAAAAAAAEAEADDATDAERAALRRRRGAAETTTTAASGSGDAGKTSGKKDD
jgi:B-cell receptor-associated protein 31